MSFCRVRIVGEEGIALLLAIFFMGILLTLGIIFVSFTTTDIDISTNERNSLQAFHLAEAGVQRAIGELKACSLWPGWNSTIKGRVGYLPQTVTLSLGSLSGTFSVELADARSGGGEITNNGSVIITSTGRCPSSSPNAMRVIRAVVTGGPLGRMITIGGTSTNCYGYTEGGGPQEILEIYHDDSPNYTHNINFNPRERVNIRLDSTAVSNVNNTNQVIVRNFLGVAIYRNNSFFTSQASNPLNVFTGNFTTSATPGAYTIYVNVRETGGGADRFRAYETITVGSTGQYIKTFVDANYATESCIFAPGDRIYIEVYRDPNQNPPYTLNTARLMDYGGNTWNLSSLSPLDTSSNPGYVRYSGLLPNLTSGDWYSFQSIIVIGGQTVSYFAKQILLLNNRNTITSWREQ